MKAGKSTLRSRFLYALILYTGLIFALWFGYHNFVYQAASRSAGESTILAANNLIGGISAEFERMETITNVIAGSSYVQDFLTERDTEEYYAKALIASEIIQKAAFPITAADSVITLTAEGGAYRFSGSLSAESCKLLYSAFGGAGSVYTVMELDGRLFFCHNAPVFDLSGQTPARIGNVVMLTGVDKTRRMLGQGGDMDTALLLDGVVILSNNLGLEGLSADALAPLYGIISTDSVGDTPLSVAAAISESAMFPARAVFLLMSLALLGLLLLMVAFLYRYLSGYMVRPMASVIAHVREIGGGGQGRLPPTGRDEFDALVGDINAMLDRMERSNAELAAERQKVFDAEILRQKMRIGLLGSQIDAHFIGNMLINIKHFAARGDSETAARLTDNLGELLQYQRGGDTLVGVFVSIQMLRKYLELADARFGETFAVTYSISDKLEACLMPRFILQPIVENAVTHGLQGRTKARLSIKGCIEDGNIRFEVSDNGDGIPPAKLREIQDKLAESEFDDFPDPGHHGVALTNIQRRIKLRFGGEYGISVSSVWGEGTTVTVTLPHIPVLSR